MQSAYQHCMIPQCWWVPVWPAVFFVLLLREHLGCHSSLWDNEKFLENTCFLNKFKSMICITIVYFLPWKTTTKYQDTTTDQTPAPGMICIHDQTLPDLNADKIIQACCNTDFETDYNKSKGQLCEVLVKFNITTTENSVKKLL